MLKNFFEKINLKYDNIVNDEYNFKFKYKLGQFFISYILFSMGASSLVRIAKDSKMYVDEFGKRVFDYKGRIVFSMLDVGIFFFIFIIGLILTVNTLQHSKKIRDEARKIEITTEDIVFEKCSCFNYMKIKFTQRLFYYELFMYAITLLGLLF